MQSKPKHRDTKINMFREIYNHTVILVRIILNYVINVKTSQFLTYKRVNVKANKRRFPW